MEGDSVWAFIQQISAPGAFINETVVGVTLSALSGFLRDGEAFVDRHMLLHYARAGGALSPTTNYSSYIHYNGHFVAVRADSASRSLLVFETLRAFADANGALRAEALEAPRQFCMRLWGVALVGVVEVCVEQQRENECAISAINNIIRAAADVGGFVFSRVSLADCFAKLL